MRRAPSLVVALGLVASIVAAGAVGAAGASAADADPSFVYDGDQLTLHSGPGQNVTGQTDLEAGTVVEVMVESETPTNPFLMRDKAVVQDDGSFTAHFDLSNLDPRSNVSVRATAEGGEEIGEVAAAVYPCNGQCPDATHDPDPELTPSASGGDEGTDGLLADDVVEGRQGETIEIPVRVHDSSAVTVVVGSEDDGYRIDATVRDGTGDGRVTLLFNTTAAGYPGETVTVGDRSDSVTVTDDETRLGGVLDPGAYELRLYRGQNATGDADVVGSVLVREAQVEERDSNRDPPLWMDEFGLRNEVLTTYSGEVATINVSFDDERTATIAIGDDAAAYELVVTVEDANGDGRATVRFDTAAGTTDAPLRVGEGDSVVRTDQSGNVSRALPPETYDVSLYRGQNASGSADVVGSLVVRSFPSETNSGEVPGATDAADGADTATARNATGSSPGNDVPTPAVVGLGSVGLLAFAGLVARSVA